MAVVKWKFTDAHASTPLVYEFHINPNEGGSPAYTKNITTSISLGPNHAGMIQEGQMTNATLTFRGVILTQEHYEALEKWFARRVMLDLDDDLGRQFRGVFSAFTPTRTRRAFNPWYHTFDAAFTVIGYKNASGEEVFGRFL